MPGRALPSPKRYAQAIFQLAREQDRLDGWLADLEAALEALGDPQFAALLDSPGVRLQDKLQAVDAVLPGLPPLARNLLALMAQRRAVSLLPRVMWEYRRLVDIRRGIQRAEVTSAIPLADADQQRIAQRLSQLLGGEVVVQARVDPSLLGGLVIKVGDRVLDGSTRNRLGELRKALVEAG